jgi:hypothetical protein
VTEAVQEIKQETPATTVAEVQTSIDAENVAQNAVVQNPVEQASTATDAKSDTDEAAGKRGQARLERRLNRLHRERAEALARAELAERRLQEREQVQQPPDPGAPKLADYEYDEAKYREAVEKHATEKARKDGEARRTVELQQQYVQRVTQKWQKEAQAAIAKNADFADVTSDITLHRDALFALMEADNATEIAYYLGTHDEEAESIATLSLPAQIRAIGRLEAKLAATPPKPQTPSKAPAPISPINGGGGATNGMPSDKDDVETWMQKENARMAKRASG